MTDYPPTPPEPVERPVMLQTWANLTFVHWRYAPDAVQAVLPDGITVDTFDGDAWVGLVPFEMRHIRPPGLPPVIPWIGTFPETNIRTYVRGPDGRPGVWFCSLDITRLGAVLVARTWYRIPYFWAGMRVSSVGASRHYVGRRRYPGPRGVGSSIAVDVRAEIPEDGVDDLAHFLTARWGLWTVDRRGLIYAPVDHPRWQLHRAELTHLEQDLAEAAGLPAPRGTPLVHWTPGVDVAIGLPRRS